MELNDLDKYSINATSGSTIHSAEDDAQDGIPIPERPLNEFLIQILMIQSSDSPPMKVETIYKNNKMRTIRRF